MAKAPDRRRTNEDRAHRQAVSETIADITKFLSDLLGVTLVAYITDSDDATVRRWAKGSNVPRDNSERRLRTTAHVARVLLDTGDADHVVRAWFIGMNPQLADETPSDVIRNDRPRDALSAARAFAGTA